MGEKGTVYFFTGLSGAGKTTIGRLFYEHLAARKANVVLKDGDGLRVLPEGQSDYSTEARIRRAKVRFAEYKELAEQGTDVVFCSIAMYDEVREWNRANIENYKEIYIKVSMETLYQRDKKGLYSSGAKNVVGVDLPWDEPKTADIVIENEGGETPEEIVRRIERAFFGESYDRA